MNFKEFIYLYVWIMVHLCDIQPTCAKKCLLNVRLEMQFSVTLYNIVQLMLYNSFMKGLWKRNLRKQYYMDWWSICTWLYNDNKLFHHMTLILNSVILFDILRMIFFVWLFMFLFHYPSHSIWKLLLNVVKTIKTVITEKKHINY